MKRGFTLIELLVVIAILAILAVAVVLVLNPVQMIKQARDATRLADIAAVNGAIALYLADQSSPDLGTCSSYARLTAASSGTPFPTLTSVELATTTNVDGTGWVDINFTTTTGGSPISRLPLDPVNSTTYFYGYGCDDTNKRFEIDAKMESSRYANGGVNDVESKDGGNNAQWYEVGNYVSL